MLSLYGVSCHSGDCKDPQNSKNIENVKKKKVSIVTAFPMSMHNWLNLLFEGH